MKKIILLLFSLLIGASTYSQDYYTGETAQGTKVTYRCIPELFDCIIIADTQAYTRLNGPAAVYKDGTIAGPDTYRLAVTNDLDDSILASIVKNTLPADKLNELKKGNELFRVIAAIEPDGSIVELGFILNENSLLRNIPVDTFYEIEKQIKAKIHFSWDKRTKELYQWFQVPMSVFFKNIK